MKTDWIRRIPLGSAEEWRKTPRIGGLGVLCPSDSRHDTQQTANEDDRHGSLTVVPGQGFVQHDGYRYSYTASA